MSSHDPLPAALVPLADSTVYTHGFLPIAAAYCNALSLIDMVNNLVPSQMVLKPGTVVQAMVLDVLSGRSPLYHLETFLSGQDIGLLLGQELDAHAFTDTNIARSLDAMFEAGTAKVLTRLGRQAALVFGLDCSILSYDTTSTSVWGEYRRCEQPVPPPGPVVTHGHSKDHQPQLKQFMTELLCVDRGVPIYGATLDGNSSDKRSNNAMLSRISTIMAAHGLGAGAFVYVADSAMVTRENLEALVNTPFISRLPATYEACRRAIEHAVDAGTWQDTGSLTELPGIASRPSAEYRSHETTVELYGISYRALVIHSSSHDKRRQKQLEKRIEASCEAIAQKVKPFVSEYHCEADARNAAAHIMECSTALHQVVATIIAVEIRQRGRPPKDSPAPTQTRYHLSWTLTENTAAVQRERELAGCFVLITSVPFKGESSMDSTGILRTYKGQYSIENDFAFLKDPLIVNDLFLKTPSRIDALGMILIIALMVWRLMERSMRLHLQQTGAMVPGWDNKPTCRPTAYMMTTVFQGIQVILLNGSRYFLKTPTDRHLSFLKALGLDPGIFLYPRSQLVIPDLNRLGG